MRLSTNATVLLVIAICGCASTSGNGELGSPADLRRLAEVRQSIRATDPGAIVGIVTQVLPDAPFVAVGDVPLEEFRLGQRVTIIDSTQRVICGGVVRRITSSAVHVEYDKPVGGARTPRVGDLVVRYSL